ncbi:CbtA family protein [Nakamurella leprariae]|uniref:CbtA family protein n=1 Tax=Nakamurella leprariae TaxID=2803911 RepID=A0A938YE14_9ACTN|nr:CbtA family protein [Nakamurella leprariae]MBM9468109.1 CbtA family protein [Nakamurella leprariae]
MTGSNTAHPAGPSTSTSSTGTRPRPGSFPGLTVTGFLIRGLLAGLIAGLITFAVAYTVGEPPVDGAIAVEEAAGESVDEAVGDDHAHPEGTAEHSHADTAADDGHSHGEDAEVSRSTQSTWGLITATVVFGTGLGGLVSLAAAFAMGRFGGLRPAGSTALIGVVGYAALSLVPFLKYPANPPAVGDPDTIGTRTGEYFAFLLVSAIVAVLALVLTRRVAPRLGWFAAGAVALIGFVVVMLIVAWLFPVVNEVSDDFPAALLWEFRSASMLTQATLWGVLTVVLSLLVQRADPAGRRPAGLSA